MGVLDGPIERVNYYNGERLDARDFRAEQAYQIRVRRILNRALYSPGIVEGLEVTKDTTNTHQVIVAPGLAFDSSGREIILLEATPIVARGVPSTSLGTVFGNFLVISYAEERGEAATSSCAVTSQPCAGVNEWRGPTRIRSQAKLGFVDTWPSDASGLIVLAQIELKKTCQVAQVHSGVRKYAVAAKPPKVRLVSLEGEKDVDAANPKRLYFHVDGGYPDAVTLYLRAFKFSSLYYTELGRHNHGGSAAVAPVTQDFTHTHTVSGGNTSTDGAHRHMILVDDGKGAAGVDVDTPDDWSRPDIISEEGAHSHTIQNVTMANALTSWTHTHTGTITMQPAGVADVNARTAVTDVANTYVKNMTVKFDGVDITTAILQQLAGRDPAQWSGATLGDGTVNHSLVKFGTQAISLMQIVDDIGPGEHTIELSVASGGGQIHYNLYVE